MTAFVCVLDRYGTPVGARQLEPLSAALSDYGPEGSVVCRGPVGVVVRHDPSLSNPGQHGPVFDEDSGLVTAVAGRFRWVGDGSGQKPVDDGNPEGVGCARWALNRWAGHGSSWLPEVAGSFSLIVAEPKTGQMTIFRDHLGDLKVYYYLTPRWLIAATEPSAILRSEGVRREIDKRMVARFLGFRFGFSEKSFFRGIRELAPAHRLEVTADTATTEAYWRFPHDTEQRRDSDEQVPGEFLSHIRRSMDHHLEGLAPEQTAISLSGGLDSTALAAVAPAGVRAFSWTFDETPDGGERYNIESVSRHLNRPVSWIRGDDSYPLCDGFADQFVHENSPYVNPFAALKAKLYGAARLDGCKRVVVGDGGDVVYGASAYWLRDGLLRGKAWAVAGLISSVIWAARGDAISKLALRRLLPISKLRRAVGPTRQPWLTADGRSLLPAPEALAPILPKGFAKSRYELSVGTRQIELESEERRLFAMCRVERANPFWSWPLLDAVLRLPAFWFHRDGRDKVLVRQAFRGSLPEEVLESGRVGLLGDLFLRGVEHRRQDLQEWLFRRPKSDWPRYVEKKWLEPYLDNTAAISFGHTILWRVISYELWCRRMSGML